MATARIFQVISEGCYVVVTCNKVLVKIMDQRNNYVKKYIINHNSTDYHVLD